MEDQQHNNYKTIPGRNCVPSYIVQASGKSAWYGVFSPTKFQSHDDIPCLSSSSTLQAICIVEFKGKETSAHQHFYPPSFSQQACCLQFHPTALIATCSHPRVSTPTCQGRPIWSAFQCIFHFFCCLGVKDLLLVQEDWVWFCAESKLLNSEQKQFSTSLSFGASCYVYPSSSQGQPGANTNKNFFSPPPLFWEMVKTCANLWTLALETAV